MESTIYPLIVAGVGGLTVLAYRHPSAYGKLHIYLVTLLAAATAAMSAWNVAIGKSIIVISEQFPASAGTEARTVLEALQFSVLQCLILPLAAFVYHIFLLLLPRLLSSGANSGDA